MTALRPSPLAQFLQDMIQKMAEGVRTLYPEFLFRAYLPRINMNNQPKKAAGMAENCIAFCVHTTLD